jgi:hypothetical protein
MPSSVEYLNVTFKEDVPVGAMVFPTGWTGSLPSAFARSFGSKVTINGVGTEATRQTPSLPAVLRASPGMTSTELSALLRTKGTSTTTDAPWGVCREIQLDAGIYSMPTVALPTGNSITAPSTGAAVLKYAKHSTVVAETAVLNVADDLLQKRSIHGRGVFRNLNIDGAYDEATHGLSVHGLWYDVPAAGGDVHTMYDTTVTKCTGSGVKVNARDQMVSYRLKCLDNLRYGLEMIDVNDSKHYSPGLSSAMGALYLDHCATPKFFGFDFWGLDDTVGTWTVTMINQTRALFQGGEISGRIGILGRNDQTLNRWELCGNVFDNCNFKIDPEVAASYTYDTKTISAFVYVEDTDGLKFSNCKLQYDDNQPDAAALAATPDYFIHIDTKTTGGDPTYRGAIRFSAMSNIVARRSRPGAALPPLVAFKKNICNLKGYIEWDFDPLAFIEIPYASAADVPQNCVLCGPFGGAAITYQKADYPIGFLWHTGLDLDNVATSFDLIEPRAPLAGHRFVKRVWP